MSWPRRIILALSLGVVLALVAAPAIPAGFLRTALAAVAVAPPADVTPAPTPTDVPPTPTLDPAPTATPAPATATPTPTAIAATSTATPTPLPATATPTEPSSTPPVPVTPSSTDTPTPTPAASPTATATPTPVSVAFDRALRGSGVGQHKVPPRSRVTVQISATVSAALPAVTLVDHLPASWSVAEPGGGIVGGPASAPTISWDLGPVAAGGVVTATYDLVSPDLTTPPTSYDFASELLWSGGAAESGLWRVMVADPPLEEPQTPSAIGLSSTSIGIGWVPASDGEITGYRVYRSPTSGGTYSLVLTTTGGQLVSSVEDTGLPSSTLFYYKVSSYTATAESIQVGPVSASTTAPAPPRGPRAVGGDGSISLNWSANAEPNLRGYNVYRSPSSGGAFAKLNPTPIAATSYVDSGGGLGGVSYYFYRITAVDGTGAEGKPSAEVSAKLRYNLATSGPHGGYSATTDACASCHRTHTASGPALVRLGKERDLCLTCHDGTGSQYDTRAELAGTPGSSHPLADDTLSCSSCHDSHLSPQTDRKILDAGGARSGNAVCYTCHGPGTTVLGGNHQTPWESGFHKATIAAPPSGTGTQCSTCHLPHASTWRSLEIRKDESSCYSCHDGSTAGANVLTSYTAGSSARSRHDVSDADQAASGAKVECVNCHNPHAAASASKVVNPEAPSMANLWTGTKRALCEECHDNTYPTSGQTEPYAPAVRGPTAPLVNVASTYLSDDQHGDVVASANPKLDPAMGYSRGDVLSCDVCHDSHGSANPYALKTSVRSKDGSKAKGGLIVVPAGSGYDLRYFCNACHDASNMGNGRQAPSDCTSCHVHGKGM